MTWPLNTAFPGGIQIVSGAGYSRGAYGSIRVTGSTGKIAEGNIVAVRLLRGGFEMRIRITGPVGPFPCALDIFGVDSSPVVSFTRFAPNDGAGQPLPEIPEGVSFEAMVLVQLNDQTEEEAASPRTRLPGAIQRALEAD